MRISDWSSDVCSSDLLPGSNLEVVASGTDLEADEIADAGEVADIGMLVDRPAALAPGARRQFDFSDRVGGDRERQVRHAAGIAIDQIGRASCRERVCQYV